MGKLRDEAYEEQIRYAFNPDLTFNSNQYNNLLETISHLNARQEKDRLAFLNILTVITNLMYEMEGRKTEAVYERTFKHDRLTIEVKYKGK